jgi:periplasmic protein TonB
MKTEGNRIKSEITKISMVVSLVLLTLAFFSQNVSGQKSKKGMKDGAYQKVDVMPVFPGGDEALLKYVADSTHYPKEAKEKGIQGKVIARFVVKKDGSVSDVSILKGVNPLLDNEAIRVVKTLPKFTPGELNGKKVPVWFMIPITYALN